MGTKTEIIKIEIKIDFKGLYLLTFINNLGINKVDNNNQIRKLTYQNGLGHEVNLKKFLLLKK